MSLNYLLTSSLEIAKAEFKLKNEGTYLGILWYLVNPLLMFLLLLIIFSTTLGKDIPEYTIYLLLGVIMINLFQQSSIESTRIISLNEGFVRSINFPKEALVIATVIKTLFSHVFEIVIFIGALMFFDVSVVGMIYYIPILILFCFFIYGISLFLSSLTIFFIDLENIWFFVSKLLLFATPIFYFAEKGSLIFKLNLFNPLYYFISVARELIIYSRMPELWLIGGMFFYTFISLVCGLIVFRIFEFKFAEKVR